MKLVRLRRNPWMTAASLIPWALVPLVLVAGMPNAAFTPHLLLIGLLCFLNVWWRMPNARKEPVDVRVEGAFLRVGQERVSLSEITAADLVPTIESPMVRIMRRGRIADHFIMRDDAEAHELLTALGFDASQRATSYRLSSLALVRYIHLPFLVVPLAVVAMLFVASFHAPHAAVAVALAPLVAVAVMFLKRASLVVGADGLLLRWLWVREFIATKDVASTGRFEADFGKNPIRGVEITLKDERKVQLPISLARGDATTAMIHQRIDDVIALDRSAAHVGDEAVLLARGDRPLRDWISHLKAMGAGATR